MPDTGWDVAQLNIGMPVAPVESEALADFMAALDPINAIADASRGFVWRLQTDAGNATAVHCFDDERLIVNLSVWESLESLGDFVYRSAHVGVMRRRREWFMPMAEAYTVLWWVPRGHRPSVAEAEDRLMDLRDNGSSSRAFSFREPHPPPGTNAPADTASGDWLCPA
jgi:hypothetical protein